MPCSRSSCCLHPAPTSKIRTDGRRGTGFPWTATCAPRRPGGLCAVGLMGLTHLLDQTTSQRGRASATGAFPILPATRALTAAPLSKSLSRRMFRGAALRRTDGMTRHLIFAATRRRGWRTCDYRHHCKRRVGRVRSEARCMFAYMYTCTTK